MATGQRFPLPKLAAGSEYKKDTPEDAVKTTKLGNQPITLLVKDFDRYRTIAIDYHDGLRYPLLVRIDGRPDRLWAILAARK